MATMEGENTFKIYFFIKNNKNDQLITYKIR